MGRKLRGRTIEICPPSLPPSLPPLSSHRSLLSKVASSRSVGVTAKAATTAAAAAFVDEGSFLILPNGRRSRSSDSVSSR